MQESILVLGADGFIGRAVVKGLAASDWASPILGVRRASRSTTHGHEQRIVDATDSDSVAAVMAGTTAVVNCVAGDERTIEGSTMALITAAQRDPRGPRIVHLSSMAVYGSTTGLVGEETPLRGDIGPYSQAKIAAEEVARRYPKAIILRPGCVFGPGSVQWSVRMARLLLARRLGDLGPAGDGCCNLVHVGDVAQAVLSALRNPLAHGRAYNLSLPDPPTWNEFLIRFAISLGATPVRRLSARRLRIETRLLAPPLKIAEILARVARVGTLRLPPPIPPSLLRVMGHDIRLDVRRVESELGLIWRDLDASLQETARWFLDGGTAT